VHPVVIDRTIPYGDLQVLVAHDAEQRRFLGLKTGPAHFGDFVFLQVAPHTVDERSSRLIHSACKSLASPSCVAVSSGVGHFPRLQGVRPTRIFPVNSDGSITPIPSRARIHAGCHRLHPPRGSSRAEVCRRSSRRAGASTRPRILSNPGESSGGNSRGVAAIEQGRMNPRKYYCRDIVSPVEKISTPGGNRCG